MRAAPAGSAARTPVPRPKAKQQKPQRSSANSALSEAHIRAEARSARPHPPPGLRRVSRAAPREAYISLGRESGPTANQPRLPRPVPGGVAGQSRRGPEGRAPGTRAPPHPPGAEEKEGEVRRTQTAPSRVRARALAPSPAEFNTMPTPTPCATPRPAQQPGRRGRGSGQTRRGEERAREPETARDSKKPEARVRAPACERGGGAAAVAAAAVGAAAAGRSAREAGPAPVGPDPSPPPPSLLPSPKPTSAACGLAAEEAAAAAAESGGASEGLRT